MAKEMRKVRTGSVVRTRMDKTAVVELVWKQRHRLYRKQMRRVARFHVHDPLNQCRLGDIVRIQEVRPVSKTKRWRLLEILERHQVADVKPIELESDAQVVLTVEETGEQAEPTADEPLTGQNDEEGESAPEDEDSEE